MVAGEHVFISYARADGLQFTTKLKTDLENSGQNVWIDLAGNEPGDPFDVRIEQAILSASYILAVMTDGMNNERSFCRKEIHFAQNAGKRVVPIRIDPTVIVPILLCTLNWIDFSSEYETGLNDLISFLNGDDSKLNKPVQGQTKELQTEVSPQVSEQNHDYTITSLKDNSYALAKRYDANILVNPNLSRNGIEKIITKATADIKDMDYYRNEMVRQTFGKMPADIVWLAVYTSSEDAENINWICRTYWVNPNLDQDARPGPLGTEEYVEDIEVSWNDAYESRKTWYKEHTADKKVSLQNIDYALEILESVMDAVKSNTESYESTSLSAEDYIRKMKSYYDELNDLLIKSGDWPFPSLECSRLDKDVQSLIAYAHNSVLPFSTVGLDTWGESNRVHLVRHNIEDFFELLPYVKHERKRIS